MPTLPARSGSCRLRSRRDVDRAGSRRRHWTVRRDFSHLKNARRAGRLRVLRYALHHLPDFWKALARGRIADVARSGAVFRLWDVVYSSEPGETAERIEAWCATGGSSVESEWGRAEVEEHVRDENSTFTWLLEPMIERAGFRIEDADTPPDGIFASYILRRR